MVTKLEDDEKGRVEEWVKKCVGADEITSALRVVSLYRMYYALTSSNADAATRLTVAHLSATRPA